MAGFCKAAWGLECGPFIECEADLGIIDDMTYEGIATKGETTTLSISRATFRSY
jgi:hypothetical protein